MLTAIMEYGKINAPKAKRSLSKHKEKGVIGQGLLEFALIVLFLVLLLFGAFDLGRIFHTKIVISNAAREAARYLVRNPEDKVGGYTGTISAAINEAQNSAVTLFFSDVAPFCVDAVIPDDGCARNQTISVTINKTYSFFLSDMLGSSLAMSSVTQMYLP